MSLCPAPWLCFGHRGCWAPENGGAGVCGKGGSCNELSSLQSKLWPSSSGARNEFKSSLFLPPSSRSLQQGSCGQTELATLCTGSLVWSWRDAPDSGEKFPIKSDCFQFGACPREPHDGWTPCPWARTAPGHVGRGALGAGGGLAGVHPAPRVIPAPLSFLCCCSHGNTRLPLLKEAHPTCED